MLKFSSWIPAALAILMPALSGGAERPKPINTAFRMEIVFPPGKSVVDPAYDADIQRVADDMKNYPYVTVEIQGYTDDVGSDAVNLKLSQSRAESVRRYLVDKFGIMPDRIKAHGYGEQNPIASNKTEAGRRQNRRIVAVIRGQPPGD
jgi:OOP family OmpA-OmpF porin